MGNLGTYQWITTTSKKVGGPVALLGLVAVGGYAVFRSVEAGGKYVYKLVKKKKGVTTEKDVDALKHTVIVEGVSNEGVTFKAGDVFYILAEDGDCILIDKIGDPNSPYYISKEFMNQILNIK